jgi:hypothetical protein
MTDRELLELAAKAAGIPITVGKDWHDQGEIYAFNATRWNPLTDDGDALRLAVKLNLLVLPYPDDNAVRVTRLDLMKREAIVSFGTPPDQLDATRRAIVRAAAEIGRSA